MPTAPTEPLATPAAKTENGIGFAALPNTGGSSKPLVKQDPIKLDYGGHYSVGTMCFRRSASDTGSFSGTTFEGVSSAFPDQRIRIEDIMSSDDEKRKKNPLAQKCDGNTLRYFHFPANNMRWIEEAMALYYGETWRPHDDAMAVEEMRRYEKLLRREFWRGQVHGGSEGPIHARHMRPRCSVIPRSPAKASSAGLPTATTRQIAHECLPKVPASPRQPKSSGKDIALFLPYLHWEHHALQKRIQREIDDANDESKVQSQGSALFEVKKNGIKRRKTRIFPFDGIGESGAGSGVNTPGHNSNKGKKLVEDTVAHWREGMSHESSDGSDSSSESDEGRRKAKAEAKPRKRKQHSKASTLANLLWRVAQVAVEMKFVEKYSLDTKMLRSFVHHDPPLHIRRTLDQFYFHTLEDTRNRDCDQVVHRGTRAAKEGKTRIIMVDQLWLWILDDNTVITAFPKRWGRNKLDDSGVHKSIRVRLNTAHKDGIKSVYHLALIIIDQCSRVFFDRTKSRDNRPEMLDLFGSAIGNMTELTSISYSHFWRHINSISFDSIVEATAKKWQRYLDINPEGQLLQESQDICEELMILLHVYGQQITVVKEFRRHLATLKEEEARIEWRVASQRSGNGDTLDPSTSISESTMIELAIIRKLDRLLSWHFDTSMSPFSDEDTIKMGIGSSGSSAVPTQEADVLLELIESRRLEIQELEDTASRTCNKLEGLLSLKQQQASILEAKAAKVRADQSIKQGRSIIAFTVVTIFFLPLGFLGTFFGMNNSVSTGSQWMTLNDQVQYMFGISAVVVVVATSLAFSQTARTALSITLIPLTIAAEHLGMVSLWRSRAVHPLLRLSKSGNAWRNSIVMRREQDHLLERSVSMLGKGSRESRLTMSSGEFKHSVSSKSLASTAQKTEGRPAVFLRRLSGMRAMREKRGDDYVINKAA